MPSKNRLRVLSIDFDYFQIVGENTIRLYPDGIDLPTELTMITWMTKYLEHEKEIMDVKADEAKLNRLIDFIKEMPENMPCKITNSHRAIYEFIMDNMKNKQFCQIMHIDMHHDCVNDNPEVDCGNWISHVNDSVKHCQVKWIANPLSKTVYGLDDRLAFSENFEEIFLFDYDCIFLCRSDNWTPPHLDGYFDRLSSTMIDRFTDVICDDDVLFPRNMDEIMKNVTELRQRLKDHMS